MSFQSVRLSLSLLNLIVALLFLIQLSLARMHGRKAIHAQVMIVPIWRCPDRILPMLAPLCPVLRMSCSSRLCFSESLFNSLLQDCPLSL